ncbi:LOW QUALITY PROTEIN: neural proliferation differentiation and control protein 1-like [Thalassophryne amazonica]|uniref:LOW QUALITY PROTEIN: neural proliferation differentiation and control protein 1-like n=1 Tax=Thalassophryne amazonica TaxID=390379 RepID=UPI001471365A|nr:LOW QUALITY PROTEIN: neural proliferation differentiation and control protein 1-like [Thalassophryne amazonica]
MTPLVAPLCPRNERQRPAWLLLLTAVLLSVCATCAGHPAAKHCQRLDCVSKGRHICERGSSHCGPCLSPLEENEEGRCVNMLKHRQNSLKNKVVFYPGVDEEIDYLHSVVEKQQITQNNLRNNHPNADVVFSTPDVNKPKPGHAPVKEQQIRVQLAKAVLTKAGTPHHAASASFKPTPQPTVSAHPQVTSQPRVTNVNGRRGPIAVKRHRNDAVIIIIISLCVVAGTVAVIVATVCYIRTQKESRLAQKLDYPTFRGVSLPPTAANGISMGDKALAHNAQMFHYQHQKQQMLSLGKHTPEQKVLDSEATSEEEEVGGDFTVYECPGLAPTGEMEVKNPLFDESNEQYQQNQK